MKVLVDSREMKQCDACTISYYKVPSMVLMERAALSVVEEIEARGIDRRECLVACGLGNNGGDGLAIARLLFLKGSRVTVVMDWKAEKASLETRQQYEILKQYEIPVVGEIPRETSYSLIVDAVFGIGLSREIEGYWREGIEALNQMSGCKVAVDMPSGISADDGQRMGCAFLADLTVTFAYQKRGLLLYPGLKYAGAVVVKEIGIDDRSWREQKPSVFAYEKSDLGLLPKRRPYSNKGSYGKVLVIGGKHSMAGAAYLSGKAAAITGCGLVKLFTPEDNRIILQQLMPEAVLEAYLPEEVETEAFMERLQTALDWADAIVAGPGMGQGRETGIILERVLKYAAAPMILDADALNVLAQRPGLLRQHQGFAVVTPHLGEMARLTGQPVDEIRKNLIAVAESFANEYNVICVLKDARTVTALPEGTSFINTSGNQGMATAGAGDVLTGIIAGLLAQGMDIKEASPFGVYLHGAAGDIMKEEVGCYSMMASDIIEGVRRITRKESENEYL